MAEEGGIDPVKFGEMCGYVKSTHCTVLEIKEDLKEKEERIDQHHDRLMNLENRNKNIKDNWKKAGWVLTGSGTILGGVWTAVKYFGSWFV